MYVNMQTTFLKSFSWNEGFIIWYKFLWNLFFNWQWIIVGSGNSLGAEQATNHYLNQWWPSLLTHAPFGLNRLKWTTSLGCFRYKDVRFQNVHVCYWQCKFYDSVLWEDGVCFVVSWKRITQIPFKVANEWMYSISKMCVIWRIFSTVIY